MCNWFPAFLTNCPQAVKLGKHTSSSLTLTLSTSVSHGCALSPLLYVLLTSDCQPTLLSNTFKFSVIQQPLGLILNNDEAAYRQEVQNLTAQSNGNKLVLNTKKTKKKIIVDFRNTKKQKTNKKNTHSLVTK